MRLKKATLEQYIDVYESYLRQNGAEAETASVITWAMGRGDIGISEEEQAEIHRQRLSEALRQKKIAGTELRAYVCVQRVVEDEDGKKQHRTFWSHVDEASDDFLRTAWAQRRDQIKADIASLEDEVRLVNDRRREQGKRPIQMRFSW